MDTRETDTATSADPADIQLSENARSVLEKRYLKKNERGETLEEPIDMFRRVAGAVAEAEFELCSDTQKARALFEDSERKFLRMMLSRKFMPNSPTLMNAGRDLGQLSACFVLPVEDDIPSIYDTLKHQAIVHKSGGGTGFGFSRLRPRGDVVSTTMGVSSGPVSFMSVFDASTEHIKQGGFRRGANMGILRRLSGDTVLQTAEGPRKIADLAGERPYLFTCHPESGHVNVVQADRVFVSDRNRKLVRVSFDDGSHLDCTPDHRFMLREGAYREAASLSEGERIMALDDGAPGWSSLQLQRRTLAPTGAPKRNTAENLRAQGYEVRIVDPSEHGALGWSPLAAGNEPTRIIAGRIDERDAGEALSLTEEEDSHLVPFDTRSLDQRSGSAAQRVARVEELKEAAAEVYDVSMPTMHNFCAGGVFVHNCDHPDIEEFIECKRDNEKINNFNISVAITDEFMEAVREDSDFDLVNPRDSEVMRTIRARDLFEKIVHGTHLNGEPGVVFIDKIDADNPTPQFPIESTNPCSEAHLPPYDSCNLGSINLERFVVSAEAAEERIAAHEKAAGGSPRIANGRTPIRAAGERACVDWAALKETVRCAVRFLDNVVEVNRYPLAEIDAMSRGNRRIGLGVMGFADALIQLGAPYDSERALELAESIMEFVDRHAWEASRDLASERGVFANWEGSVHDARDERRVRNATVTTIAPTGTISMIAGCSGGIEPLFAVAFMRRQAGMEMADVNPEFVRLAKERGFYSEDLMKKVAESGSARDVEEVPEDVRTLFATAGEISPQHHVRMQAAFQKHTSMGISKTINLPNEATTKDVEDAYMQAFDTGCKGVAVYRDGSRDAQVLSTGATAASKSSGTPETETSRTEIKHVSLAEARDGRPKTLSGMTKKLQTGHGPLYVTMNDDEFGPRECFIVLGKPGGTAAAFSDALGRMVSLAERYGASPKEITHQLGGIQDGHPYGLGPDAVLSVPDGVAKAMAEHYLAGERLFEAEQAPVVGACPDCGAALVHESGCVVCKSHGCGFSRCS